MPNKTSHLQDHLGFWLRKISSEVHAAFEAKLEKAGISIPEWCVLIVLFHDKQATPALIAQEVGIDRAAISRTVEKLVKRGFIQRGIGADRRYTPLELTKQALEIVPKLAKLADENDRHFFSMLSLQEKENLQALLHKISFHIGAPC